MKKFLIATLLICILSGKSYGAVSGDTEIYVRKDVFEARMDRQEAIAEKNVIRLEGKIDSLERKLDSNVIRLEGKIDSNITRLEGKIEANFAEFKALANEIKGDVKALNTRINNIETVVYWGIGVLALLAAVIAVLPLLTKFINEIRRPSMTADDVERIVRRVLQAEMNNV